MRRRGKPSEQRIGPREKADPSHGLKDATELDEMLAAPISDWAVKHSEAPDDEHEIYDRAIEYLDQLSNARERFNTLSEPAYVN